MTDNVQLYQLLTSFLLELRRCSPSEYYSWLNDQQLTKAVSALALGRMTNLHDVLAFYFALTSMQFNRHRVHFLCFEQI